MAGLTPYYDRDGIVIYHADCMDVLPLVPPESVVVVTDPPYGIDYRSNMPGRFHGVGVANDDDIAARDVVLAWLGDGPFAVFGSWKRPRPPATRTVLIWAKNVGGMGDLSIPWSPDWEEIYIGGSGWSGHRGSSVLRGDTVVTWSSKPGQRKHPNEKPANLMRQIIEKASPGLVVFDPYMGSGPIAQACHELGRRYIGVEIVEEYCEVAVKRLAQQVLPF